MKHAVGQDNETESTEHCPKYVLHLVYLIFDSFKKG